MEHFASACAPQGGHRGVHPAHGVLELLSADFLAQVVSKDNLEVLLSHLNDAEAELELNVFIMDVDQILNGLVDDVEGAFNDIDAHLARAGDGYWVRIDGLESLFVHRVLAG